MTPEREQELLQQYHDANCESARATQLKMEQYLRDYPESNMRKEFLAAPSDPGQCAECAELDGSVYDVLDPSAPALPLHFGCRCMYISHYPGISTVRKKPP